MSVLPRRAGLRGAVVATAVALSLAAPRADAAPEVDVRESSQQVEELELARQVAARQRSLADLNRRADARDRALVGLKAVLAVYGYTGDPDTVTVVLPMASYRTSAGFGATGPLWEAEHGGQDFGASAGEPLVAVAAGEITEVAYAGPYGLRTILTLADGTDVWYCHQLVSLVAPGQSVEIGELIGLVGSTGNSTGPHLHLEVHPGGGGATDPAAWLASAGMTP